MSIKETVYLARDNAIDLELRENGAAVDLDAVTRMILTDIACVWSVDSQSSHGVFNWMQGDGRLTMKLGSEPIPVGTHWCHLIVFDPGNPNGTVWGEKIGIKVAAICAAPVI